MQTIVITGISSGIGLFLANQFAAAGDKVVGSGRRPYEDVVGLNNTITYIQVDLSIEAEVNSFIDAVLRMTTFIDVFINNASDYVVKGWSDLKWLDFTDSFMLNAAAPALMMTRFLDTNIIRDASRHSTAVVINSESGYVTCKDVPCYGAGKAAQLSISKSLSSHYREHCVSISTLVLGPMNTSDKKRSLGPVMEKNGLSFEQASRILLKRAYFGIGVEKFISPKSVFIALQALIEMKKESNGAIWRIDGGSIPTIF